MEYGLWNFHGGFWTGSNAGFPPGDGILRNFYTSTNNEIEPPTFHITSPVNVVTPNAFTNTTGTQQCQAGGRTDLEFLSVKHAVPENGKVSSVVMSGHQDELLQSVALEDVPMATDLITEQNSLDSLAPTDSSIPPLLSHQQNPNNNSINNNNNNNDITSNNNNNNNNNKDGIDDNSLSQVGKKDNTKVCTREDEVWEDVNGQGTNIKLENNPSIDYLFQQSYQHQMYGMVFSRVANNKRELGTSDETDEEDDETEEDAAQQVRIIDNIQNNSPLVQKEFRSSQRDDTETQMVRHPIAGHKLNGKKRSGPLTPQRVRYEREEYRCQICAYSCTVEKAFYKHLKIHSVGRQMNQIKISCVICGKDRSSELDMNKHMKKHRDDRYFCCDICIFKTVQLKKLIQHRRMHTGEKPHLCPHCSYRSARRDNLRSHVRRVHKKDNLFCDTFSPRGLLLTENSTNAPLTTSIASANSSQHTQLGD